MQGFSGDGGAATSAKLNSPTGIAFDGAGNLYISDQSNHRIRKVSTNGIITTVAGSGISGSGGDGGPATGARLNSPFGIDVDVLGNIYIVDQLNHRVRKVNTSGIISTVAGNGTAGSGGDGGAATSANLNFPTDVVVNAAGELYIADPTNARIRKVSSSGIITTVLGDGSTAYSGAGLDVDDSGNLYLANYSHRVIKADIVGNIVTIAGLGNPGFSGDGGAATSARLNTPTDVLFDAEGAFYIADRDNNRIRKVNPNGIISTVAGNGVAGFSGDGGLATNAKLNSPTSFALDGVGNLYIVDKLNNRIRKLSPPTITLNSPICRQTDSFEVFYTSTITNPDHYIVTGTGISPNQTGTPPGSVGSIKVSFDPATFTGSFTLVLTNSITGFSTIPANGTVSVNVSPTAFFVTGGGSFCAGDSTGAVGLDGSQSGINYQLLSGGTAVGNPVAGTGSAISFGTVTEANTYSVVGTNATNGCQTTMTSSAKIEEAPVATLTKSGDLSTTVSSVTLTATPANGQNYQYLFTGPSVVSQDPSSNIASVNMSGFYTVKISRTAGCFSTATVFVEKSKIINTVAGTGNPGFSGDGGPATSASLGSPYGVTADGTGNIYVADQYNHRIRKISSSGAISTIAGNGTAGFSGDGGAATNASLSAPARVALDGSGNLYIADQNNNRIRKVSTNGIISTIAGNGTAGFAGDGGAAINASLAAPTGVAVDESGYIYIADRDNNRIRKVGNDGIISTFAGNGVAGVGGDGGTATIAGLYAPTDVAVDGSGNVFIADRDNSRIRKVTTNGIINTVAGNGGTGFSGDGGSATSATLTSPSAVTLDISGNLFIADGGNFRIRRVDASGIISTVAGNGIYGFSGDGGDATSAKLTFPSGIATDGMGNLYIADTDNHRIRKLGSATSFVISIKTGDWNDPNTWNVGRAPLADDQVILDSGHTVTINGSETARSIEYRTNAQLVFSGSGSTLALGQ
ncbi:hypothetical protein GBK04_20875 [Cytophagaceae bacterium SJW1-29]|uniref:Teneurin NHL domain-containing protein n=2 Tax=Salmonirosea aquatica TaxID=2654236 RepID=A0A7C9BKC5_9BACT|nr:hypothetical protein [Cytophagaceae bacterium SJW1-29]